MDDLKNQKEELLNKYKVPTWISWIYNMIVMYVKIKDS